MFLQYSCVLNILYRLVRAKCSSSFPSENNFFCDYRVGTRGKPKKFGPSKLFNNSSLKENYFLKHILVKTHRLIKKSFIIPFIFLTGRDTTPVYNYYNLDIHIIYNKRCSVNKIYTLRIHYTKYSTKPIRKKLTQFKWRRVHFFLTGGYTIVKKNNKQNSVRPAIYIHVRPYTFTTR